MCYVYAIKSAEKKYIYVGLTNNPDRKIAEHNRKKEKTTRLYVPFKAILIEKYNTRLEARKREKYLKSGIGKEYLRSL
jgi:putative endonuclease